MINIENGWMLQPRTVCREPALCWFCDWRDARTTRNNLPYCDECAAKEDHDQETQKEETTT